MRPPSRLALGLLLAAAALIAASAAAFGSHPALGFASAGIAALTLLRMSGTLAQAWSGRDPSITTPVVVARFLASLGVAAVIFVGSATVFFLASLVLILINPGSGHGDGPRIAEFAAVTLVAILAGLLLSRSLWPNRFPWSADAAGWRALIPGLSVGKAMKWIAVLAIIFALLHAVTQRSDSRWEETMSGHMYAFCLAEAALFDDRSESCRQREADGVPWNDPGRDSELLRTGPYPWDHSRRGTWAEQAEVWKRAADQARKMAGWHYSR